MSTVRRTGSGTGYDPFGTNYNLGFPGGGGQVNPVLAIMQQQMQIQQSFIDSLTELGRASTPGMEDKEKKD